MLGVSCTLCIPFERVNKIISFDWQSKKVLKDATGFVTPVTIFRLKRFDKQRQSLSARKCSSGLLPAVLIGVSASINLVFLSLNYPDCSTLLDSNVNELMSLLEKASSAIRTIRSRANVTSTSVCVFLIQLASITFLSLTAPFFIRGLLAIPFVELNEPLEFTFHTCTDQLHGVCSFPEAEIIFDEVLVGHAIILHVCFQRNIEFEGNYKYRFTLIVDLTELEVMRATGLFLAQLEVKDGQAETLAVLKKTARAAGTGFYDWYIWVASLV